MTATISTIFNQKGGAGKTFTTMQVMGALVKKKKSVLIIDADPQKSATDWKKDNPDLPCDIYTAYKDGEETYDIDIHKIVAQFYKDYDHILIDCPPAVQSKTPASALIVSDIAIVPFKPSSDDLRAFPKVYDLVLATHKENKALSAIVIPNMFKSSNLYFACLSAAKANTPKFTFTKNVIPDLVIYGEAALLGTPLILADKTSLRKKPEYKKARKGLNSVMKEVLELMDNAQSNITQKAA